MGHKAAVKLHVDVVCKFHLANKSLVDPRWSDDLPAEYLHRLLAHKCPRKTDGIATHIPDAPAAQFRLVAHIRFAREDIGKGPADQLQISQCSFPDQIQYF